MGVREKNILRFQVTVDYIYVIQVLEALENLSSDSAQLLSLHALILPVLDELIEVDIQHLGNN